MNKHVVITTTGEDRVGIVRPEQVGGNDQVLLPDTDRVGPRRILA